jgi:DNA-binding NarL/FixJ family response regulator
MAIRCLIVDDNQAFLDAARVFLERDGLTIAGVALTSVQALLQIEVLRPEVVLVDISLGTESGFDLARRIAEDGLAAEAVVILISTRAEEDVADLIAESPVAGFLPKEELSASAIHRIAEGQLR